MMKYDLNDLCWTVIEYKYQIIQNISPNAITIHIQHNLR